MNIRRLKNLVGLLVSAVILFFLFRSLWIYWRRGGLSLSQIRLGYALLSVGIVVVAYLGLTFLWKNLYQSLYGQKIEFYRAVTVMFFPNIMRYIPGKVWFVFGVDYWARRWNMDSVGALTTTLIMMIVLLLSSFLLGVVMLGFGSMAVLPWWVVVAVLVLFALALQPSVIHFGLNLVYKLVIKRKDRDIPIPKMSVKLLAQSLVMGIIYWIIIGIGVFWSVKAISVNVTVKDIFSVIGAFAIAYFVGYVSIITPAGLGVRESVLSVLLPSTLDKGTKILASLVSRVFMTFSEFLVFLIITVWLKIKDGYVLYAPQNPPHSDGVPEE